MCAERWLCLLLVLSVSSFDFGWGLWIKELHCNRSVDALCAEKCFVPCLGHNYVGGLCEEAGIKMFNCVQHIYYVSCFTLQCTNSNVHFRSCILALFESMFEMLLYIADQHRVARQNDV